MRLLPPQTDSESFLHHSSLYLVRGYLFRLVNCFLLCALRRLVLPRLVDHLKANHLVLIVPHWVCRGVENPCPRLFVMVTEEWLVKMKYPSGILIVTHYCVFSGSSLYSTKISSKKSVRTRTSFSCFLLTTAGAFMKRMVNTYCGFRPSQPS